MSVIGLGVLVGIMAGSPAPTTRVSVFSCPERTVAEQAARADLIMTGEVTGVLPGEPYGRVMIRPIHVYKGQPGAPTFILARPKTDLTVSSNPGDLHFQSDQPPYLLFLRQISGGFLTSRCDGSRFLGDGLTSDEKTVLEK
jgi:hypothetical protein